MNVNPIELIAQLPPELTLKIIGYLPTANMLHRVTVLDKEFYSLLNNNEQVWEQVTLNEFMNGNLRWSRFLNLNGDPTSLGWQQFNRQQRSIAQTSYSPQDLVTLFHMSKNVKG